MISYLWLIFSNKIFMIILYIYNILNMNINPVEAKKQSWVGLANIA